MGVRFNKTTVISLTAIGLAGIAAVIPATSTEAGVEETSETTVVETTILFETAPPPTWVDSDNSPTYQQEIDSPTMYANAVPTTTTAPVVKPPAAPVASAAAKCPQWHETALEAGWPADQLAMVDKVIFRESTCRPDSWNKADPAGGSRGLMQINGYWCEINKYNPIGWLQEQGILTTCEDLFTPVINLRAALAIWQRSGWGPWGF